MEHYISKQGKKCVRVRTRTHCAALQDAMGSNQVHFLAPHGCLTSGVHAARPLHHLCSRKSVPPCWQPSQGERRVAEPPWGWPYPGPTAETPGCYPTLLLNFSPPQTQLLSTKRGKIPAGAVKLTRGGGSLCVFSLSNSLLCVFYLTGALVLEDSRYWKCRVRLYRQQPAGLMTSNVILQFDIECRHKCYICCLLMLCVRKDIAVKIHREGIKCHLNIIEVWFLSVETL